MRYFYLFVILVFFVTSCSSSSGDEKSTEVVTNHDSSAGVVAEEQVVLDENYSGTIVSGTLESVNEGVVFIEVNDQNRLVKVASGEVDSLGNFEIRTKDLQKEYVYRVSFPHSKQAFIYLDTNRISIKESKGVIEITESEESAYYNGYMDLVLKYNDDLSVLNKAYQHYVQTGQQKEVDKTAAEFDIINAKRINETKAYLSNLPASVTLMNGVSEFVEDIDTHADFIKTAIAKFENTHKVLPSKDQFVTQVKSMLQLTKGNMAPDLALPTPDGEILKLSSLRGNYVLVDFWASWCGPCRAENPNVVKLYNEYKKDNFEILGVSLDKDRDKWLAAIEKDGLTWKHVSDLKHWQSEAATTYGIKGIPFTVLIDPKGKIIDKNLRGEALKAKLKSIFKH